MAAPDGAKRGRPRLADVLYARILEQIVAGALEEGARLPSEHEMCRMWGVSRPTLREALVRLHADGLVTARQGAGTFVGRQPPAPPARFAAMPDLPGVLRCLEVRSALEGQAAGLAARRRTPEQMEAVTRALDALAAVLDRDADGAAEDFGFHLAVAGASGNPMFGDMLALLERQVRHGMSVSRGTTLAMSRERAARVLAEHGAVADAIRRGDAEAAALCMRFHLHCARQRVADGGHAE